MRSDARLLVGVLFLGLLAAAAPTTAQVWPGGTPVWSAPNDLAGDCVEERSAANGAQTGNVCTANDLTFVLVGRGIEGDACVNGNDTANVLLRAVVRNTTSQTRYDVGLFVAQSNDPTPADGALSGRCAYSAVGNPGPNGQFTCPVPLDLAGTLLTGVSGSAGPYVNADGPAGQNGNGGFDSCSDVINQGAAAGCDEKPADGLFDDTVIDFTNPVTIACADTDGNGFLNIATCATWGNVENQVDSSGNGRCESSDEIFPGTKSKCRCEPATSDLPAPNLQCQSPALPAPPGATIGAVTCTYNGATLGPTDVVPAGATVQCTVEATNTLPALVGDPCTTDPAFTGVNERFGCGRIGYIRWRGELLEGATPVSPPTGFTRVNTTDPGDGFTDNTSDFLWTTAAQTGGTLGIVYPNETSQLTFSFTVPENTTNTNRTLDVRVRGEWSDNSSFNNPVNVQTSLTCTSAFTATPITLARAAVRGFGDDRILEWTTATEAGNVGFHVLAETEDGLVRLNDRLIPSEAVHSTRPLEYSFDATGVDAGRFWIEEVDTNGQTHRHGPFRVGREYGRAPETPAIDWQPIREEARRVADQRRLRVASGVQAGQGPRFAPVDLLVREDGVYRVTYEELAAAGFDWKGAPLGALAVTQQGQAVPIRVIAVGKGYSFGPGSAIEFFGEGLDSLYTDTNVYRLVVSRQNALRIGSEPAAPQGPAEPFHVAQAVRSVDKLYSFASPSGDPWYETRLLAFAQKPVSTSYEFQVDRLVEGGRAPVVEVDVWGESAWLADPDHHVSVLVNNVQVAAARFDGVAARTLRGEVPAGVLRSGKNTLAVQVLGDNGSDWDLVNVDGFRVSYARETAATQGRLLFEAEGGAHRVTGLQTADFAVYRIDPAGVTLLDGLQVATRGSLVDVVFATQAGVRYAAVSGARPSPELRAARVPDGLTKGRAEYLVISHPAFLGGLDPIVQLHEANGLAVKVVDVEDVYARFGGGVVGVEPIRDYVRYAAFEMGTEYVLLVGADTYDYHDNLGLGSVSFVPTPFTRTDSLIAFAPVDPLYGDVDGDLVPDLSVGRFPVRTLDELESMVGKTLEYAAKSYGGTAVIAADRRDASSGVSFLNDAETFRQRLGGYQTEKAYLDQSSVKTAQQTLVGSIERGTALTVYFGHSGPSSWTFDGLFSTREAKVLSNFGKPTVVVQWGCWNTYHVEPSFDTLGHQFLVNGYRGAAAVLGSATLLNTRSEQALAPILASRLVEPGLSIGHAVTLAKQQLAAQDPSKLDVILGWTILGDPALVIEN